MMGEECFNELMTDLLRSSGKSESALPINYHHDEIISSANTIHNYHLGVLVLPNSSYKLRNLKVKVFRQPNLTLKIYQN